MDFSKPPKRRYSSQYRTWLTTRIRQGKERCPICGETAEEGHHEGPHSAGRKPDDWWMVPLCKRCHDVRHHSGLSALLPIYQRSQKEPRAELPWVVAVIGYTQRKYLRTFVKEKTGSGQFLHDLFVENYGDYDKTIPWINALIAWIEAHHPEWIQSRPKRTSLGKRKPNKRGGCRPLSPNKRMSR